MERNTTIQVCRKQAGVQRITSHISARLHSAKSKIWEILQDKWPTFFNKYVAFKNEQMERKQCEEPKNFMDTLTQCNVWTMLRS